jgi:hypothetical protein
MRGLKTLFLFLAVLVAPGLVSASPSIVQVLKAQAANATSVSLTLPSAVTAGNIIYVACNINSQSFSLSIASVPSNTFTAIDSNYGGTTLTQRVSHWTATAVAGSTVFTCSDGGNTVNFQLAVYELSGVTSVDQHSINGNSGLTATPGSITTAQQDLGLLIYYSQHGGLCDNIVNPITGFTEQGVDYTYGNTWAQTALAAGSYNPSCPQTPTGEFIASIVTFKSAAAQTGNVSETLSESDSAAINRGKAVTIRDSASVYGDDFPREIIAFLFPKQNAEWEQACRSLICSWRKDGMR